MATNNAATLTAICLQMGWYDKGKTMPVLLVGAPGTAKTQFFKQLGKKFAEYLLREEISETFHVGAEVLTQTQPETIEGIPAPDFENKQLIRLPLANIRKLIEAKYGIWFGDEVTSAPPAVGAACMTLIQDGVAGDETLPESVGRGMAANPPDMAAGSARDLTAPEINRVMRIEWKLPDEDFLNFMEGGPGLLSHVRYLPKDWEAMNLSKARTLVANFLKANRDLINVLDSKKVLNPNGKPWASQRQWWNYTRVLAALMSIGELPNSEIAYMAAEGLLGDGIADQIIGWMREMDLPDPEVVLAEAMKVVANETDEKRFERIKNTIPKSVWDRPDKLRIFLDSLSIAASSEHFDLEDQKARWTAAWLVMEPVLDSKPDNALASAKRLCDRIPPGSAIPAGAEKLWRAREAAGMVHSNRRR